MSALTASLIQPDQVWADADSRRRGRTVQVDRVGTTRVHVTVLTNSHRTQNLVDAGHQHLDQRGRTSVILKERFASDCYTPARPPRQAIRRLPNTCTDHQKHRWQPTCVMAPSTPVAHVVLVCTACHSHTTRESPYLPSVVTEGDLAA
ncbi:hypothetical protein ACFYN0_26805 [Streptomyces sp. NPDC006704]|uniref:hypothetical protein n=1 Tax=Streptomyces sp. NPDC006704 TaxID=3364760 RepID=UPI00369110B9